MLLGSVPGLAVVGTAADGAAAVALAREEQPDVVVMDVQMPVLDGIEATRRITGESPSVGVVVLTMSEDDGTVFAAVRAGARGYLLKGADQEEVVRAITTVAGGGAVFGAALARRIAEFFAAGPSGPETTFPQLTAREREVLDLVAAGRSNAQIARRAVPVAEDGAQQRLQRADEAAGHRPGAGDRAGPRARARTLIHTGARLVPLSA
ncbi:two component transcriptional regulator, LuxR family [Geodermatophilus africanus]|uniref:Two component transcriptional regulator, LuxR family n=1 Tax=Geodermatophilus africanus TaxID=1137993 RepID=A0A1H3DEH8_9ACTN|nr:two component transcriptional regulator, LuxR family [Geodermatophilus africanus]